MWRSKRTRSRRTTTHTHTNRYVNVLPPGCVYATAFVTLQYVVAGKMGTGVRSSNSIKLSRIYQSHLPPGWEGLGAPALLTLHRAASPTALQSRRNRFINLCYKLDLIVETPWWTWWKVVTVARWLQKFISSVLSSILLLPLSQAAVVLIGCRRVHTFHPGRRKVIRKTGSKWVTFLVVHGERRRWQG